MAALSIGTQSCILQKLQNSSFSCSLNHLRDTKSSFCKLNFVGMSLNRIEGARLVGNSMLARAEDKAGKSSSLQSQQARKNSQQQFQELPPDSGSCDPLRSVDETSSQDFEANNQPKTDFVKALAVFAAGGTGALAINQSWVAANQDVAMALVGVGYAGIIFEESLSFNKSGVGSLMAVSLWVIRSIGVIPSSLHVLRIQKKPDLL